MPRPLSEIAAEIKADYAKQGKPVYYAAAPYVDALLTLNSPDDYYYNESGRHLLNYLIGNLRYWKGDTAIRVKSEIREILSQKP
jgi:hypothetical protein